VAFVPESVKQELRGKAMCERRGERRKEKDICYGFCVYLCTAEKANQFKDPF
jgi:hypothetical protein